MPDITMCLSRDCPQRHTCYRHEAKPSQLQSYFVGTPMEGGKCAYYWPIRPEGHAEGGGSR